MGGVGAMKMTERAALERRVALRSQLRKILGEENQKVTNQDVWEVLVNMLAQMIYDSDANCDDEAGRDELINQIPDELRGHIAAFEAERKAN